MNGWERKVLGGAKPLLVRERFSLRESFVQRISLGWFQSFDAVKIHYDDGQKAVTRSLHAAVEYVLSKESLLYRYASPSEYRLAQAADMLCTLELTAQKFRAGEATRTDEKFFGSAGAFSNNFMKAIKRKRL